MSEASLDLNTEPFVVRLTWEKTSVRVALLGELDMGATRRLAEAVEDLLTDPSRPAAAHFDLRGLLFLDLVGARALVRACDRLASFGTVVDVSGLGQSISRILQVSGINLPGVDGQA